MGFQSGSVVKNLPASGGDAELMPGAERSPGKEMATPHLPTSILAWRIPWTEPDGLQSMGSQKSDLETKQQQQQQFSEYLNGHQEHSHWKVLARALILLCKHYTLHKCICIQLESYFICLTILPMAYFILILPEWYSDFRSELVLYPRTTKQQFALK